MKILLISIIVALAVGVAHGEDAVMPAQSEQLSAKQLKRQSRRTMRGYRMMVDAGASSISGSDFGFFPGWVDENKVSNLFLPFRAYVSTTHGYQFNNYVFLGGGVEFGCFNTDALTIPIFADLKVNFTNADVSPFAELKGGAFVGRFYGMYLTRALGVRIRLKKLDAINVAIESTEHKSRKPNYKGTYTGIMIRVGYEF